MFNTTSSTLFPNSPLDSMWTISFNILEIIIKLKPIDGQTDRKRLYSTANLCFRKKIDYIHFTKLQNFQMSQFPYNLQNELFPCFPKKVD